jgi:hypothetical protein
LALDGGEVSFKPWPPSICRKSPAPNDQNAWWASSWSGHFREENNILFQPKIEAQILSCSTYILTTPTTLSQLIVINQCHINKSTIKLKSFQKETE